MMFPRFKSSMWLTLAVAFWVLAVGVGYCWMTAKSFQKAPVIESPTLDLKTVHLLDKEHPTLFVFLHPECPCSEATVEEVGRISERCEGDLKIIGVFADYTALPRPPKQSAMWHKLESILGARPLLDENDTFRHSFHAKTSGESFLLDPEGHVLFHGGLTTSRGHSGPSIGGDAIISSFSGTTAGPSTAPVFGCALDND